MYHLEAKNIDVDTCLIAHGFFGNGVVVLGSLVLYVVVLLVFFFSCKECLM